MTGKVLKELLLTLPMTLKEIADKIGVKDQALFSTFNSPSVKSNILEDLARELGLGMAFFYPELKEQKVIGNDNVVQNTTFGNNSNETTDSELIQTMRAQIASQAKTLDALTLALQALSTNK